MAVKKRKKRKTTAGVRRKPRRSVGKRKPVKRKKRTVRRKAARRKPVKRRRRTVSKAVTGSVSGTRKRRRKRRVVMASRPRRRRVGSNGGGGGLPKWLLPVALGAAALYFVTKKSTTSVTPGTYQLPPLTQTQNVTRNNQSNDLINYAIAGGLAVDAIMKLIDKLNNSSDQQVQNIYDTYHATGELDMVYV
jgi:hypothetical protein